jgi:hypothetical protein
VKVDEILQARRSRSTFHPPKFLLVNGQLRLASAELLIPQKMMELAEYLHWNHNFYLQCWLFYQQEMVHAAAFYSKEHRYTDKWPMIRNISNLQLESFSEISENAPTVNCD